MSRKLTLEEQRDGLAKLTTNNPYQYEAKMRVTDTINKLIALREQIEKGPGNVDSDRFAEDLAAVLGS